MKTGDDGGDGTEALLVLDGFFDRLASFSTVGALNARAEISPAYLIDASLCPIDKQEKSFCGGRSNASHDRTGVTHLSTFRSICTAGAMCRCVGVSEPFLIASSSVLVSVALSESWCLGRSSRSSSTVWICWYREYAVNLCRVLDD